MWYGEEVVMWRGWCGGVWDMVWCGKCFVEIAFCCGEGKMLWNLYFVVLCYGVEVVLLDKDKDMHCGVETVFAAENVLLCAR